MKFGLLVPQGWRMDLVGIADPIEAYETMTRVAQEAEAVGFDSIWLFDHFHTVPTPAQEVTFECWTSTAALARDTRRVRIGQMVTCNGYRNPALLAKMASTVDVLSHGRLDFGIGAGWYEHEFHAFGYDFPDGPTRLRQLRDAVQIILKMWTDDEAEFEGKYHQVHGAINQPKGVQKPHIPLLIGGGGEQVTLKLVAQYGARVIFLLVASANRPWSARQTVSGSDCWRSSRQAHRKLLSICRTRGTWNRYACSQGSVSGVNALCQINRPQGTTCVSPLNKRLDASFFVGYNTLQRRR